MYKKIILMSLLLTASLVDVAYAAKISDLFNNVSEMGGSAVTLISTFAKVGGIGVFVWGLWDWYQSGQQNSQIKMKTVWTKVLVGALLVGAPFFLESTLNQVTNNGVGGKKIQANLGSSDNW